MWLYMNNATPFSHNTIAIIWDFDKTLIAEYMQEPLFKKFGVNGIEFWQEVNKLESYYAQKGIRVNKDTIYLNHILTYVQEGIFKGLNNNMLSELGKELVFYPGLPEFFPHIKKQIETENKYKKFDIKLEHYIVSTGFSAMIRGSAINDYIEDVWGCEFIENAARPKFADAESGETALISQIGYAVDNTSKTRALFEINKGVNKHPSIDVNARMSEEYRRIPFQNMIYIVDGPSDVPAFSIMKKSGGYTYAVYPPGSITALRQVDDLLRDGRINMYGEANYAKDSHTYLWLEERITRIADSIVAIKEQAIRSATSEAPKHII